MARKKDSPQKAALRELMGNYLKENNVKVKDGTDVNSIMRDMMSIILEGALDQELGNICTLRDMFYESDSGKKFKDE